MFERRCHTGCAQGATTRAFLLSARARAVPDVPPYALNSNNVTRIRASSSQHNKTVALADGGDERCVEFIIDSAFDAVRAAFVDRGYIVLDDAHPVKGISTSYIARPESPSCSLH